MIINRHNYEEFFLLYVDNELNDLERAAVEQFVQQNPDLEEEMDMLKQAILPGEIVEFEDKELLYNKAVGISLQNYEEYFLLSVDQQLTKQENEEVEKFVLKHPELQNEFVLLEQTRLQPEAIVFEGKEKLYRKEGKERPVVFLTWVRISVAAAVIGLVTMTWLLSQNNNDSLPVSKPVAATPKPVKPLQEITPAVKPNTPLIDKSVAAVQEKTPVKPAETTPKKIKPLKAVEQKSSNDLVATNDNQNKPKQTTEFAGKTLKVAEDLQSRKAFEDAIASAKIDNKSTSNIKKDDQKSAAFTSKADIESNANAPLAIYAAYKELDTRENDEENTFYLGAAEINKNKLKGLFKKATSLFDRRNNNNDGERTLKIAGFEIKSK